MEAPTQGRQPAEEPVEPSAVEPPPQSPVKRSQPRPPRVAGTSRVGLVAAPAWVLALTALTLPSYPVLPDIGIDPSWQIGIITAFQHHLNFGTDIIWSYGPYGWLDVPFLFDLSLPRLAIVASICANLLFLSLLAAQLWRRGANVLVWVVVAAIIGLVVEWSAYITFGASITFAAILLLIFAFDARQIRYQLAEVGSAGALLALGSLVKCTDLMEGAGLLVVAVAFCVLFKRRHLAMTAVFALLSFLLLWIVSGAALSSIPAYVRGIYETASGYSAAMSRDYSYSLLLGVSVLLLLLLAYGVLIALFVRDQTLAFALSLCVPIAFVAFKEGFVRHTYPSFFEPLLVLLCVLAPTVVARASPSALLVRSFRPAWWCVAGLIIGILFTTFPGPYFVESRVTTGDNVRKVVLSTLSESSRQQQQDRITAAINQRYPLSDSDLAALRDGTVDVMPWDTVLVYGYHLNWNPRPVLASYAAYTPYLDHVDAAHLASPEAATLILYYFYDYAGELDNRYALYDEPEAYRALLENYGVADNNGPLLLERRATPMADAATAAGQSCSQLGSWIAVPSAAPDRFVYASVAAPYSLVGRVLNTAYKPAELRITFQYGSGLQSPSFRLIGAVAPDGLLISGYAETQDQFADLFRGRVDNPITAFQVSVPSGAGDYSGQVCATFVSREMPASS